MITTRTTLEHDGKTYYANLGTIRNTMLGVEDHGTFTSYLHLNFRGTGQGAGGYTLDTYNPVAKERSGTAFGADLIMRQLEVVGVSEWEKLPGRKVYALYEDEGCYGTIVGIAGVDTDKVLIFRDHALIFYPEKAD